MIDNEMNEDERTLQQLVETLYECKAGFERSVPLTAEAKQGSRIVLRWRGEVSLFHLEGSKEAKRCLAWDFEPQTDTTGFAPCTAIAPEVPPVNSPTAAVRNLIIERYRWSERVSYGFVQLRVDRQ